MKILVIRHGQTDWNKEGRIQGRTDIPLNQKGIEQANQTSQRLKDEPIDLIICSPLKRCKKTAEIISGKRNIPIVFEERLLELSYGRMEGRLSNEVGNREEFGNVTDSKFCEDAESSKDFMKRVFDFLEELKNFKQKNVLLVTHNEVCKAIHIYFSGYPKDNDFERLGIENCEVVQYEIGYNSHKIHKTKIDKSSKLC